MKSVKRNSFPTVMIFFNSTVGGIFNYVQQLQYHFYLQNFQSGFFPSYCACSFNLILFKNILFPLSKVGLLYGFYWGVSYFVFNY